MRFLILTILLLSLFTNLYSQDTLRRENGVLYLGNPLITSPNTLDGFGSADGGVCGDSLVYTYIEVDNSYNGENLENSSWISYGDLLPTKFPPIVAIGLGYSPDTFRWNFQVDTLFVEVKDAETENFTNYTFLFEVFDGANSGLLDSLYIAEIDGTVAEPSIIQIFPQEFVTGINSMDETLNFSLFPNPSSHSTHLSFYGGQTDKAEITVYSIIGKTVFKETIDIEPNQRNLYHLQNDLTEGVYLIKLEIGENVITRRWTKL